MDLDNYPLDTGSKKRFNFIVDAIKETTTEDTKIIDLACSEGYLHQVLKTEFGDIDSIDFDGYDYGLQYNKPKIKHDLNVYPYPIKDKTYTHIVAGEIIEHLHNPTLFLKECHRILKDDGYIIITTPNACGIHVSMEGDKNANYHRPYGHISLFCETSLKRLLNYTNFKFIKIDYCYYRKYSMLKFINKRLAGANFMLLAKKEDDNLKK